MPVAYAVIHEEAGHYGISFPDFPGCISSGDSAEDACRRGADTLTFHVAGMIEDGDPLPMQRGLNELGEPFAGGIVSLVKFELPGRAG